jgi:hypothetical protein
MALKEVHCMIELGVYSFGVAGRDSDGKFVTTAQAAHHRPARPPRPPSA